MLQLVTFLGVMMVMITFNHHQHSIFTNAEEATDGINLICRKAMRKGSFDNHLQSLTWESPQQLYICIDNTCVLINKADMKATKADVIKATWIFSKPHRDKVLMVPNEQVRGIYFLRVGRKKREWLMIYMQDAYISTEGEWLEKMNQFTLVHGPERQDGEVPYMFAIDWDLESKHFIFYSLDLNPENYTLNIDKKDKCYFATWAPGIENTLRLVPKPLGVPSRNAFADYPKGIWTDTGNGTFFLFDDQKGCVYAVLGWTYGFDLAAKYDEDPQRVLDFKVIGTPYEDFFNCPDKYPKNNSLDKDRCYVIGEEDSIFPRSGRPFRLNAAEKSTTGASKKVSLIKSTSGASR